MCVIIICISFVRIVYRYVAIWNWGSSATCIYNHPSNNLLDKLMTNEIETINIICKGLFDCVSVRNVSNIYFYYNGGYSAPWTPSAFRPAARRTWTSGVPSCSGPAWSRTGSLASQRPGGLPDGARSRRPGIDRPEPSRKEDTRVESAYFSTCRGCFFPSAKIGRQKA